MSGCMILYLISGLDVHPCNKDVLHMLPLLIRFIDVSIYVFGGKSHANTPTRTAEVRHTTPHIKTTLPPPPPPQPHPTPNPPNTCF